MNDRPIFLRVNDGHYVQLSAITRVVVVDDPHGEDAQIYGRYVALHVDAPSHGQPLEIRFSENQGHYAQGKKILDLIKTHARVIDAR